MTLARTYLDWNATAPLHPAAREAMVAALDVPGNPSSPHAEGRRARSLVETAREDIAQALGVAAGNVYFTSGATEAANWVLTPQVAASRDGKPLAALLVSATEHACVLAGHRFPQAAVEHIAVDAQGVVDVDGLCRRVAQHSQLHGPRSVMIALQAANNETGVVQPVNAICAAVAQHEPVVVCDGVQAVGRLAELPAANVIFLSAHKLGGPKGVGAVIVNDDTLAPEPLFKGGGQERRQRSGTENVAGIAGFAAALKAVIQAREPAVSRMQQLRDRLEVGLKQAHGGTIVFGEGATRLPNTTAFALPGLSAETALIAMDLAGIAVSSGSACSSGKVATSHVLAAMGVPAEIARGALRVSMGPTTTAQDVEAFLAAWTRFLQRRVARAA